jgi:type IV secretory pathway TrbD component
MNTKTKAMVESYGRHLLGAIITAVVIVGNGASPLSFTVDQWADVANAIWAATIPVALRYINKKDPAFGRIAEAVVNDAQKALDKKIRAKKAAPKK